ncbi:retron Ec67 family RNA-directed DNA polymerase/endonuclease [Providencia sp. wls1921]|uniref:retron Ec67 family RNA-directed DNA polymerase/endonuclease n=1 Tax=Providencia sp. wls1921 TaxID=2675153 RepID=UPI0012B625E0|nr:retron Ec67 family RNA-directed DNA polymerase/endonuclease [Providencia sp. wls1921]MTC43664.1 RNA-directed DNA polymerase [Providencia sp. wls1921]
MSSLTKLKSAKNKVELAAVLGVSPVFLTKTLYKIKVENLYTSFTIKKKSGGDREILAPDDSLKDLQQRLSNILLNCLDDIRKNESTSTNISHGFERKKSIITNALKHTKRKIVLNLDLENFFDCFNFGRVRGFFIKNDRFLLNEEVATVIAQISCVYNKLPQGSPCSPVITNLICSSLDIKLNKIARKNKCTYTRYADDITFSTSKISFGNEIVSPNSTNKDIVLGKKLKKEIIKSGFTINYKKIRIQNKNSRQDVTGLVVNNKVNTKIEYHKNVRAMCHNLFKTGNFNLIDRETKKERIGTIDELEGMLSFIDNIDKHNNIIYKKNIKTNSKKSKLEKNLNKRERVYSDFIYFRKFHSNELPTIITEGHTDQIHIKCALTSLYSDFPNLIEMKNENYHLKFNFLKLSKKNKWLLGMGEGTDPIRFFISNYIKNYNKYPCFKAKKPVIILLDNDSGSKGSGGILSLLTQGTFSNIKENRNELRKKKYIHVYENLYVIFTPLIKGNDSCIEDLYDRKTLEKKLNGKKFKNSNLNLKPDEYSKNHFAKYVIQDNIENINFDNFKQILESLDKIILEY